jgi:hypothetical protein
MAVDRDVERGADLAHSVVAEPADALDEHTD